jgi:hypothetical protein
MSRQWYKASMVRLYMISQALCSFSAAAATAGGTRPLLLAAPLPPSRLSCPDPAVGDILAPPRRWTVCSTTSKCSPRRVCCRCPDVAACFKFWPSDSAESAQRLANSLQDTVGCQLDGLKCAEIH